MKIRLLAVAAIAAASILPAAPASATHMCAEGFEGVCDAQHILIYKIDQLVTCKILNKC